MSRKKTSLAAVGSAILGLMILSGCGGNNVTNPTTNVSNFQAINQGNPNQARLITVVPSATQVTSLVSNTTNLNQIVTTAGSTITTTGALSLCGNNNVNLSTGTPTSEAFAVNSGSVTPVQVNANGTLVLGTPTNPNDIVPFTGGQACASDGRNVQVAAVIQPETNFAPTHDVPAGAINVLDTFTQNGNNSPGQGLISPALPAALTSITTNVDLQTGNGDFETFAANGTNTQFFVDADPQGTAVSVDGASTDLVVTDSLFTAQGGNTPNQVVVAVGPQTVAQTQGGNVFGINVGSAFLVETGSTPALVSAGNTFIPLGGATATTVPVSATFVYGNSVNGSSASNPAFLVIGTNTPTVPLVIIPVNQQVNQENGFLNLAQANPLLIQFDGQGVTGLNTPQDLGQLLSNGFDTENAFVGVTGSGAGSVQNAFGAAINPLSDPALLFGDLVGDLNIGLGTQSTGNNANPVAFTSTIFP